MIVVLDRPGFAGFAGLLACALVCAACTDGSGPRCRWESWNTLELEASAGILLSGSVVLNIEETAGGRRLETRAEASVFGATVGSSRTESILDPATGRTRSFRSTSGKRGRRYLFGERSYTVEKLAGPPGPEVPLDDWEVESLEEFPYAGSDRPYDYYGMLLHLRDLELNAPGDEATIHIATTDGPRSFGVRVAEQRTRQREYTDLATGETRTDSVDELRLRLVPDDGIDEGFLAMEGEIEVWVEARSKTPIEIRGKVPKVPGTVRLLLTAIG
jgi:hypothetical protein